MKVTDYVPESPYPKLTNALVIDRSVLVLPDVEVPYHDAPFINKCITLAAKRKVKALALPGDWVHWASLAHFFEAEKDVQGEITSAQEFIEFFLNPFEEVYYCAGNHDRRPQHSIDRFLTSEIASRLFIKPELAMEFHTKVKTSDFFHMDVGYGDQRWRLTHPNSTNTVPANAAKRIAESNNCNVAMAHDHLVGIQQTADGRHYGMEIGCCVDPQRLAYVQSRDSTRPKMKNGALLLEKSSDGVFYPTLLSEGLTNWEKELK